MSALSADLQTLDAQVRHYGAIRHRLFNQRTPTNKRRHSTIDVSDRVYCPPVRPPLLPMIVKFKRPHVRDWIIVTAKPYWEPQHGKGKNILIGVCLRRGIHPKEVMGQCRSRKIVACRAEIYAGLRRELGWSDAQIAKFMGRERTTVLHAIRQWEAGRYT